MLAWATVALMLHTVMSLAADPTRQEATAGLPTVWRVGPSRLLTKPSQAASIARSGDSIEIDAGSYLGDTAVWTQHDLVIRGKGGLAHIHANGAIAENKAIWVIKGNNATIEDIEFSGATAPARNGAGIRLEGTGLTVRSCYFHHNENGILTGANRVSDIIIEHSEFAYNGYGDGYSHNLYIGNVRTFSLRFSYVHHAVKGHNVKSRALTNHITYNRIMDEGDGTASYAVDLPDGGLSYLIGNVIQQGAATQNRTIIAYGAEGFKNPINELYVVNNTLIDDLPAGGRFISVWPGALVARVFNNLFSGAGDFPVAAPVEATDNIFVPASELVDPKNFDYRPKPGSAAVGRSREPGQGHGVDLRPAWEYVHKAGRRARSMALPLDLGALQSQS